MQQQIDDMALEISELRGELERNSYDMKQMLDVFQRELFYRAWSQKRWGESSRYPATVAVAFV